MNTTATEAKLSANTDISIHSPLSEYTKKLEPGVRQRYLEKNSAIGIDPFLIQNENFQPDCLPPVECTDLLFYLVLETSFYTQHLFKAFRSLEAYNQMVSGFMASVKGHIIGANKFVVLAKGRHSQRLNDSLIPIWTIAEKEGTILSAHCVGTGKEGSLTTANYHINSPGIPPTSILQDESNSADNDVNQRAEKDSKLTEMEKNQQDGNILQTKIAKSVAKVLGTTPLVKTLDKARNALREKRNRNDKYCHDKYKDTLACVQTQVLAAHKSVSQEIEQWEKEFLLQHGFAPTYENYEQEEKIKAAYKKKKLSKELLKYWKITVYIHP
ncbi:hypothetical protein AWC38_SpisGene5098 [Stylophora pistillata]|uniref:Uncharacterized protein n=1 Tax=Stylophora pistillata TaxID=50429 RepID=A0A2B4SMP1_STYPI|nr:hypothetical protein AWC38_SpisGene5098 [Stylophora pistillata]